MAVGLTIDEDAAGLADVFGFEGAAEVVVDALEGGAIGAVVAVDTTFSFSFIGSAVGWFVSGEVAPLPDNRRERF